MGRRPRGAVPVDQPQAVPVPHRPCVVRGPCADGDQLVERGAGRLRRLDLLPLEAVPVHREHRLLARAVAVGAGGPGVVRRHGAHAEQPVGEARARDPSGTSTSRRSSGARDRWTRAGPETGAHGPGVVRRDHGDIGEVTAFARRRRRDPFPAPRVAAEDQGVPVGSPDGPRQTRDRVDVVQGSIRLRRREAASAPSCFRPSEARAGSWRLPIRTARRPPTRRAARPPRPPRGWGCPGWARRPGSMCRRHPNAGSACRSSTFPSTVRMCCRPPTHHRDRRRRRRRGRSGLPGSAFEPGKDPGGHGQPLARPPAARRSGTRPPPARR